MKKKILAIGLVVCMLVVAIGSATMAYFTDTEEATNVFTVGKIDIELTEKVGVKDAQGEDHPEKVHEGENFVVYNNILATDVMQKEATVTNTGSAPAYVRVSVILNNYEQIDAIGTYYEGLVENGKVWTAPTGENYTEADIEEWIQKVIDDIFNGWNIQFNHYPNGSDKDMRMAIPEADLQTIDDNLLKVDSTFTTNQGSFHFSVANWFKTEHEENRPAYDAGHDVGYAGGHYAQMLNDYELCYAYYLDLEPGDTATLFKGLTCPWYFDQEQAAMFDNLKIEIYADAIQAEGFADEIDAFKALELAHPLKDIREQREVSTPVVTTAEELATLLTSDAETIDVILGADIDCPITSLGDQTPGSGEYKLGGENTKAININLNGHKLNITTTYWSAIGAKNDDATITIKNGYMTSTGNSAGTWNAWDLRFSNCNWNFENVDFLKAVALDNAGKTTNMNNVTITDTNNTDTYGLWITAEGQTVNIDGLTMNMLAAADGRGIKIDNQYIKAADEGKVTLTVSNATFITEEKAAIMVKSSAGAVITHSNVDISKVAADKNFVVWVDEDAKDYATLVTVNGEEGAPVEPSQISEPIVGDGEGVSYNGGLFVSLNDALVAQNAVLTGNATITANRTYKTIVLENVTADVNGNLITASADNTIVLHNCFITLDEGEKLIVTTGGVTVGQVMMHNVTVNGELLTQVTAMQYLEGVNWYEVW